MSENDLLAQSLRDFSSDAWWTVCDSLVDYEHVEQWQIVGDVRSNVRRGDLLRASASYGDDTGEDEGAQLLTEKILAALADQNVVKEEDGRWRVSPAYAAIHSFPNGGIRFAYNIDGNWTTYDALPFEMRVARRQASTDRLNRQAALAHAAKYQRPVQTGEERSAKYVKAKQAAFDLYTSLLEHGYLDAFPVTVNKQGRVVSGNHRLRFAELAREQLVDELEAERANGNDPIAIADLERRITSLSRDRILAHAIVVGSEADEIRVTTASEIQIPWADHEKKQLAKRLATDGTSVSEIATRLGQSERAVREWTTEERTDVKRVQQAEAIRLYDAGWTQRRIGKHLGVSDWTIREWVRGSGMAAKTSHPVPEPKTAAEPADTDAPVAEPEPPRDMTPSAVADRHLRRLEQVLAEDSRVRPRWTLGDVEDAKVIRRLAGLDS